MAQTLENELCDDMNCSSGQTIKKCFRKWSLRNHPDKGGDEETYKEISGKINENIEKYKCQERQETTSSKKNKARQDEQARKAEEARQAEERSRREAEEQQKRQEEARKAEEELRKAAKVQADKERQDAVEQSRKQAQEERYQKKKEQLLKGFKKTILDLKNDMLDRLYNINPKIIRSQYKLFILQQGSNSYLMIAKLLQDTKSNVVNIKNSLLSEPAIGISLQIAPGEFEPGKNQPSAFSAISSSLNGSTIYVLDDESLEYYIESIDPDVLYDRLYNQKINDEFLQKLTVNYLNNITVFELSDTRNFPDSKILNIIQSDDVPEETMEGGYKRNRKQNTKKKHNKSRPKKRHSKGKTTRSSGRRRKQRGRKTQKRRRVKHTRSKKQKSRK